MVYIIRSFSRYVLILATVTHFHACSDIHFFPESMVDKVQLMSDSAKVRIVKSGTKWTMYRNNEPYYIKGGHGITRPDILKNTGGNSMIVYHYELSHTLLDSLDNLDITASVILDIGKPRLGFNYKEKHAVEEQREWVMSIVNEYKDHPAILCWIIGNEAHIMRKRNFHLWREVNYLSRKIHELDKNHPTTTTIASFPTKTFEPLQVKLFAPDLDFITLTVYEFAHRVKREKGNFLWGTDKPYMVSEWGGKPHWIKSVTSWGAVIEHSSTDNAGELIHNYHMVFNTNPDQCIGGYVFYWGEKQERTHTLFSLLLEDEYKTQAVESILYNWTKQNPENYCPRIKNYSILHHASAGDQYLEPGKEYQVNMDVHDPDGDSLFTRWKVLKEGEYHGKWGGEVEERPQLVAGSDSIVPYEDQFSFVAPSWGGAFRLFIYVFDNQQNVATANIPFYVLD